MKKKVKKKRKKRFFHVKNEKKTGFFGKQEYIAETKRKAERKTMKSFRTELTFVTRKKCEFINITRQIARALEQSGIKEGLLLCTAMHITASVFINDNEPGLHEDMEKWLQQLAPHDPASQYRHNLAGEDNAEAHLHRQIMGREVVIAVTNGQLDFGPWEQVFYGEFDGCRKKRVLIKIIGE